jgi:hypothetical protein
MKVGKNQRLWFCVCVCVCVTFCVPHVGLSRIEYITTVFIALLEIYVSRY